MEKTTDIPNATVGNPTPTNSSLLRRALQSPRISFDHKHALWNAQIKVTHQLSWWFFIFGHSPWLLARAPRAHRTTCQSARLLLATRKRVIFLPSPSGEGDRRMRETVGWGVFHISRHYGYFYTKTPSSVTFGASCLTQVDLALRSAILRCKCKIAKLMCAQKPHRGCLHDAHIRPQGEAFILAHRHKPLLNPQTIWGFSIYKK